MTTNLIAKQLKEWFLNAKRTLPWRENISPYRVWVSEIMLQQTQVQTVIPYFNKWMKAFPTLEDLAKAPLDKVIKLWEGLGYYSRARNLHKGANDVINYHQGELPSDPKKLLEVSGIGPYTQGAILSFAFKKRSILIDGNVKRVISRLMGLKLNFTERKNHLKLESILYKLLPDNEPWIFNEALMELGALICTPSKPDCTACPLNKECYAQLNNMQQELPLKIKRKKTVKLFRATLLLEFEGHILVKKQTQNLMQDLYEFPFIEISSYEDLNNHLEIKKWEKLSKKMQSYPQIKHHFTHYQVTLIPFLFNLKERENLKDYSWYPVDELDKMPFSSGHRKIIPYFKD